MAQEVMKLNDILSSLEETEKVASDFSNDDSRTAHAKEDLRRALSENRAEPSREYVEDNRYVSNDLEKIASQIAASEEQAILNEANLYGQAVCDGFMSRMGQYEDAADSLGYGQGEKTASFDKHAAEEAFSYGYDETMEKIAESAFDVGYSDTMEKMGHLIEELGLLEDSGDDESNDYQEKTAEEAFSAGVR